MVQVNKLVGLANYYVHSWYLLQFDTFSLAKYPKLYTYNGSFKTCTSLYNVCRTIVHL